LSDLIVQVASRQGGIVVVNLSGVADLAGTQTLDQRLLSLSAERPVAVVFDLSELKGISSICMGSLVRFGNGVARHGGKVVLAGAGEIVSTALRRARLDQFFKMCATLDEAMNHIAPGDPA
jgi:anti-anti-sigma factor